MKYVIIGNSAAAVGAVEAIRKNDQIGDITIISSEKHHTYSRPLISYMIMGKVKCEDIKYRDDNFYELNKCETIFGQKAVKIDHVSKTVVLESGKVVNYDKLLVATGSSPIVPPIPGIEEVEKKFTFTSLDDAKALESELNTNTRVLILGAGLIGLKCAEAICKRQPAYALIFHTKFYLVF